MSECPENDGFSRYSNTQGVLVVRPAATLESGQFFKINKVNASVSIWIFSLDVWCLVLTNLTSCAYG